MPDRREQAAEHLGLDQADQRQAVGGEQRVERVPGALQSGEPEADHRAQHDPVPHGVAGQTAGEQPQRSELDSLLDQADADIAQWGRPPEERRLRQGGGEHA
jgi:hypothetical protein